MIKITNLTKKFDDKVIINNISTEITENETTFITGQSGSGKSVLAKHICGLLKPESGEIFIDGENITKHSEDELLKIRKKILYIFQKPALLDNLTNIENIILPVVKSDGKANKKEIIKKVTEIAKETEVDEYLNKYPFEINLSIQRIYSIIRGIITGSKYIIFDEPTTSLDYRSIEKIDNLIINYSKKNNITPVIISHNLKTIMKYSDKIIFVENGTIPFKGTIPEFKNSKVEIIKEFISNLPI